MMRKFILNAVFFLIVLTIIVFLIDCITISDEYVIEKTKNTSYHKIAWNLNLINHHPEKIRGSIIFLGPSLVQGGICDSTLTANGIKSINMGINHHGKEMELLFLNKILAFKPAKVYLHLSKYELTALHPMTPLLYDPLTLLFNGQSFNVPFLNFLFHRISFVLDFVLWSFTHTDITKYFYNEYGVVYQKTEFTNESYATIQTNQLLSPDYKNGNYRNYIRHFAIKFNFIFNTHSQEIFVLKAFEYAKDQNIKLEEIYLPALMDAKVKKDFDSTFYCSQNNVVATSLKSFSFLDEFFCWTDQNHLSRKGAIIFTHELVKQGVLIDVSKR